MEPVTLTTERLILRPLETRDVHAVYAACQDPEIQRWTTVPSPYTREHAETFIGQISPDGWRDDTQYGFGVFTNGEDQLVGTMALVRLAMLHTEERQAELGYWTAKEQRGRGYTVEAARAVCQWAFIELGVQRMEWYAEAGNAGSRAVALKTGFRMEGTLRARIVHEGTRRDAWTGSLLPSDWSLTSPTPYLPYPQS
ncbi:GNAT family N-acetyltransferase [Streptantibioticus ferralitis]|uniref:GNAT family N-acetyltransferase n=1 Tax=Streptantibioticus ferralitis TaxID=236510 RepID=A0ABT5YUF2_9ACTN|nr:GNAT family N-acetyltransferase [Streptantibioticus ferralitis]MDF2255236.1 GNAT family N-acetyltransferase [Streptantibioticus ferralitis]